MRCERVRFAANEMFLWGQLALKGGSQLWCFESGEL